MKIWIGAILMAVALQQPDAETRVVNYLKANVKQGQPVEVSKLLAVFKTAEEQQVVQRLFNTFFKIPLTIVELHTRTGQIPKLQDLAHQFDFKVPGEMDLMLRIIEADPRIPRFLARNPTTGEITRIDSAAIRSHPQFGKGLERSIAGMDGQQAPRFAMVSLATQPVNSAQFVGQPHLLYFYFTNCPPCVETTPILVRLYEKYSPKGFKMIAANADKVLGLPYTELVRADYIRKQNIRFPVGYMTPVMQQSYGGVSLYPTLFIVNRQGRIVKHMVSLQTEAAIEAAIQQALN